MLINACFKERYVEYGIALDSHDASIFILNNEAKSAGKNSEAQAPGKPTENDGFIAKKKWDGKKVTHPKTGQVGWPDKKGWIWSPTGPTGHGGPHWDTVSPDGLEYDNVYPGGKVRKGKK